MQQVEIGLAPTSSHEAEPRHEEEQGDKHDRGCEVHQSPPHSPAFAVGWPRPLVDIEKVIAPATRLFVCRQARKAV
jgi:hypothetical protein